MTGRRWNDATGGRFDAARRVTLALWPFVASLAAVSALLAATIVSVGAVRDRDRLTVVARDVASTADAAAQASRDASAASEGNRRLLEEISPCDPGDDPESPGCVRQARTDAFVGEFLAKISADQARGLAAHDANVHRALEELRRRLAAGSAPLPQPTIVAPAPAPTTTVAPTTVPPTTTTTCPRLPNGRCRP